MNRPRLLINRIVKIALIIMWLLSLYGTEANYYTYILVASISAVCMIHNSKDDTVNAKKITSLVIGVVCAVLITASCYYLYKDSTVLINIVRLIFMSVGTIVVFYELFTFGYKTLVNASFEVVSYKRDNKVKVFIISSLILFVSELLYTILVRYPGAVQYDTMLQLYEIYHSDYSNHHPVVMTYMIALCIKIANAMNLSNTFGLFIYTVGQVLCISLIVGFTTMTLYEMKLKKWIIIVCYVLFLIYPLNMLYISYIQKDGLFAFFVLLMVVSLYRIIDKVGSDRRLDYLLLTVALIAVGILRSNGPLILILTALVLIFIKIREHKRYLYIVFAAALILTALFKGPVFSLIDVRPTEFSEGLSIPIQQIGRVVYNQEDITDDEAQAIEELISLDSIRYNNPYDAHCSDNIKGLIQFNGRDEYLKEHKWDYLKLWIKMGCEHPLTYIEAYIDQTMGYWTLGYGDVPMQNGYCTMAPEYDIYPVTLSEGLYNIINVYLSLFEEGGILHTFAESGLFIYLLIYITVIAIWKKSAKAILTIPGIASVLSLYISTPLYGNQRYIYMISVCLPFIIAAIFVKSKEDAGEQS